MRVTLYTENQSNFYLWLLVMTNMKFESKFFFIQCHHMSLIDFVVPPPGCSRRVTDFWWWDAHQEQLRCPDEVDGDIWIWSTRMGLTPKFYWTTQTMVTMGIFPFKEKYHGRTVIFFNILRLFRVMYFVLVLFWYSTKDCVPWIWIFPLWKIQRLRSRTRDLMISSQKLWPLDHEAGQF
jgi:hypothetical protein